MVVVFGLEAATENARLDAEHGRYTDQNNQNENIFHFHLHLGTAGNDGQLAGRLRFALTQTHVDHDGNDRGRILSFSIPIC